MDIVNIKVADIKPYPKNTKKHPAEQVSNIAKSIEKYGFIQPIVLDKNNEIVIGHGRILASEKLKMQEVPCVYAENLSDEDIKALRIIDNKLNESEWDIDFLKEELADIDLSDFDLDFDAVLAEDETEEGAEIVEDEVPEEVETRCKLGDIWKLGEHRLICGDSTDATVIDRLMDGKKADMVFTDPPYGMKKENEGVLNDNLNYDDLLEFNRQWIPLTFGALKDNGSWYCWGIDEPLMDIYSNILKPMARENKITFRNLITWDKGNGQGQLSEDFRMYPIADEKCLFVMAGVQGFNTNADNYFEKYEPIRAYFEAEIKKLGESDKIIANALGYKDGRTVNHWYAKSQWNYPTDENVKALTEYAKSKGLEILVGNDKIKKEYEQIKKEWYETRAYFNNTHDNINNVWHFDRTSAEERELTGGHATPKPIALCSRAIKSSSREGEIVLDVFGGSGSTMMACEQLKRKCYMAELSPEYADVIIARWENLTGQKAELLNGVDA